MKEPTLGIPNAYRPSCPHRYPRGRRALHRRHPQRAACVPQEHGRIDRGYHGHVRPTGRGRARLDRESAHHLPHHSPGAGQDRMARSGHDPAPPERPTPGRRDLHRHDRQHVPRDGRQPARRALHVQVPDQRPAGRGRDAGEPVEQPPLPDARHPLHSAGVRALRPLAARDAHQRGRGTMRPRQIHPAAPRPSAPHRPDRRAVAVLRRLDRRFDA